MKNLAFLIGCSIILFLFSCGGKNNFEGDYSFLNVKKIKEENIFAKEKNDRISSIMGYASSKYPKIEFSQIESINLKLENESENYKGELYFVRYNNQKIDTIKFIVKSSEIVGDTLKLNLFKGNKLAERAFLLKLENSMLIGFNKKSNMIGLYDDVEKKDYIYSENGDIVILKPFKGDYKEYYNHLIDNQIKEAKKKEDIEFLESKKI